jgi:hypothetical protein
MTKDLLFYVYVTYCLSFVVMFVLLFRSVTNATNKKYADVFYSLAAFTSTKSLSILADGVRMYTNLTFDVYGLTLLNISTMLNVISNVFLLHFGIELITLKLPHRNIYRIFPLLLFAGYLTLFTTGVFDPLEANQIARFSFGYNGAVLSSVACFSLYYSLRQSKNIRAPKGILATGVGLIIYSVFDGLTENPISGVPIYVFRMFSAVILTAASFDLVALFDEKKIRKIDYV